MARYSGRYGSINGVSQVQNWNLEITASDNAHANSFTRGAKMRDPGVFDFTGSYNFCGANSFNTSLASEGSTFELYSGSLAYGGTGVKYSGTALWTSVGITADIPSGARVITAIQIAGNGPLTQATGTYKDVQTPGILMSKDCEITFNGETVNFKSFNFTLNHEVQEYLGSDCVDENGKVWKKRYPGLIDCTGTIDIADDAPLATPNDIGALVITCGDTELLNIGYARYMSTSGLTVDPSSGALVSSTGNFSMAAHNDSGSIGSLSVMGTSIWPPANS